MIFNVGGGELKAIQFGALCLVTWVHKTKKEHKTMQRKQIELKEWKTRRRRRKGGLAKTVKHSSNLLAENGSWSEEDE